MAIFNHGVAVHTDMLLNTMCFSFSFLKSEFGMFMSYLWMQPENDEQILITTRGWVFDRLQTYIAILA